MDTKEQYAIRPELIGNAPLSDPRNPGAPGMPGANPGLNDPGHREQGGRSASAVPKSGSDTDTDEQ
jgi:hypothetical protein